MKKTVKVTGPEVVQPNDPLMNPFPTGTKTQELPPLQVPFLPDLSIHSSLGDLSNALDRLDRQLVEIEPWPLKGERPKASFALAHGAGGLFLKFFVRERWFQATYRAANDPVYKDSCVEFFIAFEKEGPYYNLEFNALGTCLMGYGAGREDRKLLPEEEIGQIKYGTHHNRDAQRDEGFTTWELSLAIPLSVFCYHQLSSLEEKSCFANFYKCGDDLPFPHFLSWRPIVAPEPNFHLREFFGRLEFQEREQKRRPYTKDL